MLTWAKAATPALGAALALAVSVGLAPVFVAPTAGVASPVVRPAATHTGLSTDSPLREVDPAGPPEDTSTDTSTTMVAPDEADAAERGVVLQPDFHADVTSRGGQRTVEAASPTPTSRREPMTYRVMAGDTVSALAEYFGVSAQTIVKANGIADAEALALGQELVILPRSGVLHTVSAGETLIVLAERYSVIPEEIAAVNDLKEPYLLQIGQVLLIPEVAAGKAAAAVAPQAASRVLRPASYRVTAGDTLSGIAARFGLQAETLRLANPAVTSADVLAVGQELTVPPVDGALH